MSYREIKPPHVMLAKLYDNDITLPDTIYIEPKIDGIRVVIIKDTKNNIYAFARSGKRFDALEKILEKYCTDIEPGMYDTEAFNESWNYTMTILYNTNSNINENKIILYVFDYLTLEEYMHQESNLTYEERRKRLEEIFKNMHCKYFKLIEAKKIKTKDLFKYFEEYKKIYEGLMIKIPNGKYIFNKRTTEWLKLKEKDIDTFKIIDVIEGKQKNTVGAFIVKKDNKVFKVGSGFTDAERKEFWQKRKELIGKCVEVILFNSMQKNAKVIFPVFHRLRLDINC